MVIAIAACKCLETQVALLYVNIIIIYSCVDPNALTTCHLFNGSFRDSQRLEKTTVTHHIQLQQNMTHRGKTPPHPDIAVEANSTGSKDPGAKTRRIDKRNPDLGQRGRSKNLSTSWHASKIASPCLTSSKRHDPNYP